MTVSSFAAVVLAGGTGARLGGADKAAVALAGRTLLEHALAALVDAAEVVVVGPAVATSRPVAFTREEPAGGGPAAGLLAGLDALTGAHDQVVVLAVDMPHVSAATLARLRAAALDHDGAFLIDPAGRRQLAGVLDLAALVGVRPERAERDGLALHRLLAPLSLARVDAVGTEAADVDTWEDLRALGGC